jgi:heme/copper-type cytochrome/quinol oxidase subunit 4
LIVLACAQIGVHLVFFLHLGSGADSTNNILALAFGAACARHEAAQRSANMR